MADLLGPWIDPNFQSGLILRCKEAWNKPLEELSNLELATFLDQNIGVDYVLPIAKDRMARKVEDHTEFYKGHLNASVEKLIQKPKQI
jgi:hypothetical protein